MAGDRSTDLQIDSIVMNDAVIIDTAATPNNLDTSLVASGTDIGSIVVACPASLRIPEDYADYATIGYLISGDSLEVMDNANITLGTEDGWTVYLRAGYSGTFDANSNTGTLFAHPSAILSNVGSVAVTRFNGAAGL